MPLQSHKKNSDGTYGPTQNSNYYMPKGDHGIHSKKAEKSKWKIPEGEEYDVFFQCDSQSYYCQRNECFFGIIDKGHVELGRDGERLAKFPRISNRTDPWHGYPVSSALAWDRPSDELLDTWEAQSIITLTTKRRIERGVL